MNRAALFLSVSLPQREPYVQTARPHRIREAVTALVAVAARERDIVFGGHPAISPLVEHAARSLGALEHIHIYQSRFFEDSLPEVAREFPNLHWTEAPAGSRAAALTAMREEMIGSRPFAAGIFIGGMEGVVDEYARFCRLHPGAPAIVLSSTGGAALELGADSPSERSAFLATETRYRLVFRRMLQL